MIKRTIEISQEPAHLSIRNDQLLIQPFDRELDARRSIPCEDIGVVLVDHPQVTYTHATLARLTEYGAVLVCCGRNHLPASILLPVADHTQVVWRVQDQIDGLNRKPLRKRLWQQLVQAKIRGQAANLPEGMNPRRTLEAIAQSVRSGDAGNAEAHAARVYWAAWAPALDNGGVFRRDTDGGDPLNAMLNYGYTVLRAALARVIVGAGLLPMLGVHHSNRGNAFCLADDLIEPLRPIVDRQARYLYEAGRRDLDTTTKAGLLQLLTERVDLEGDRGPLMVSLHRYVASLAACFGGERADLLIPAAAPELAPSASRPKRRPPSAAVAPSERLAAPRTRRNRAGKPVQSRASGDPTDGVAEADGA